MKAQPALPAQDELEIRSLIARYHDTTNLWDPDAWGAVWASDALWHLGSRGSITGRDAIVALRKEIMEPFKDGLIQLCVQGRVWATEGGAEGRWTFMEIARRGWTFIGRPAGEGHETDHIEVLCNLDHYKREEGRWVLAERRTSRAYHGDIAPGRFFGFPALDGVPPAEVE
jgi:hypothetical protein